MTQQIGEQIKENWMIILFIGSLIVGWTSFNARLTNAENEVSQLSQVVPEITKINLNLAKLSKDVEYIKIRIDK